MERRMGRVGAEFYLDHLQRNLMTQRDQLVRALGGHDSGQPRRRQRFALLEPPADDRFQRRGLHFYRAARQRLAPRDWLFADVDHAPAATPVEMGERVASGGVRRPSDWFLVWHGGG